MSTTSKLIRERNIIRHLNEVVVTFARNNKDRHPAHAYFEPIHALSAGLPVPIFGAMLLVWQLRNQDLQLLYPLDTAESRVAFLSWCVCSGIQEYALLRECTPLWEALAKPAFGSSDYSDSDPAHALSWMMVLTALSRPDLRVDLGTESGRASLLLWYLQYGFAAAGIAPHLEEWQTRFLSSKGSSGISMHQQILYQARDDLRQAFSQPAASEQFNAWYGASSEFQAFAAAEMGNRSSMQDRRTPPLGFGVNVIGHVSAVSGIAEDSRMALAALRCTTVATETVDFAGPVPEGRTHPYNVNLFCFPALEQARYVAELGLSGIVDRYNIGYWPWEISHWPEQWQHLFSLVDEVWASSEHIRDSLRPVAPVPVLLMTMAVETPPVSRLSRADFRLPEDTFLFYFAFDLRSSAARKNPEACIASFQQAFPAEAKVGLVVKALKTSEDAAAWKRLECLSKQDKRIHVIDQTLSRADLMALYTACDCFVSLHRAEGFGRNIAEAMLLGKPVVVTDYSGNRTFTKPGNSVLVPYALKEMREGEYPHVLNGVWAEPDIRAAAAGMRRIAEDATLAAEMRTAACHSMLHHSTFRTAQHYLSRLNQIKNFL